MSNSKWLDQMLPSLAYFVPIGRNYTWLQFLELQALSKKHADRGSRRLTFSAVSAMQMLFVSPRRIPSQAAEPLPSGKRLAGPPHWFRILVRAVHEEAARLKQSMTQISCFADEGVSLVQVSKSLLKSMTCLFLLACVG